VILLVWAVYGLIQIYKRGRKEATLPEPKIDALWDLTQQYRQIDPDLQEWFATNSATAMGISVEDFLSKVGRNEAIEQKRAQQIANTEEVVNCVFTDFDGNKTKGILRIPHEKYGDMEYARQAAQKSYPHNNFAHMEYDYYPRTVPKFRPGKY